MKLDKLYLIGSLRNPEIVETANHLQEHLGDTEVFASWFATGPEADDYWRKYEEGRGNNYLEALKGHHAKHVFDFDIHHLSSSDAAVLALPAGRSGHLELGWMVGTGKPGWVLLDFPDRWDVMYQFATVCPDIDELTGSLIEYKNHASDSRISAFDNA